MGLIDVKEKVIKTLGGFLDRNKDYIVEVYISNSVTDKGFTLKWDNSHDIKFNNFSVIYDEILACYDETDEYDQQMVFVVLKCGVSIDFECCGMI